MLIWNTPMITANFILNELKKFSSLLAWIHLGSNPIGYTQPGIF